MILTLPLGEILKGVKHYLRLQIFSIIMPGLVLLLECSVWGVPSRSRRSFVSLVDYASAQAGRWSAPVALSLVAFGLVFSYGIGFIIRQAV